MLRTKQFSKEDLTCTPIEIGENGFISPLTRNAMLQENFSHIYNANTLLQSSVLSDKLVKL